MSHDAPGSQKSSLEHCASAEQGLTGTKLGCGEGGCGACTVMLSKKQGADAAVEHMSVNACLCPLYAAIGCHVVTVEGIGNPRDGLHPVQVCATHPCLGQSTISHALHASALAWTLAHGP